MLAAIYSLIFYQHYKIEKSKTTLPESEPKAGTSFKNENPLKHYQYGNASFLLKSRYTIVSGEQLARLGFYD